MTSVATCTRTCTAFLRAACVLILLLGLGWSVTPAEVLGQGQTSVIDLTFEGASGTYNGAVFFQGDVDFESSGTGVINPFLRISTNQDTEKGYNSDLGNKDLEFDEDASWTKALLLSALPQVEYCNPGCEIYREFFLDINEPNNDPAFYLSLDELEVYEADSTTASPYASLGTPVWELDDVQDNYIALNYSLQAGSGERDVRFLIPDFGPEDCNYGNSACTTYMVLYAEFGGEGGGFINDSGFEEFSTSVRPFVDVSKTADASLETIVTWEVDKSVDKDDWDLYVGDSGEPGYTVDITKSETPGAISLTGTITIYNPPTIPGGDKATSDAVINGLSDIVDEFDQSTDTPVIDCGGAAFPVTLGSDETLTCTYSFDSLDETEAVAGTNTVTVTLDVEDVAPFTYEEPVSFTETITGDESVTLADDQVDLSGLGLAGPYGDTTTGITYEGLFDCDADGSLVNVVTITGVDSGEDLDTDTETVTYQCHELTVAKDATTSYTITYEWTVDKSVDRDEWWAFENDVVKPDYTVDVTRTAASSMFGVAGDITVTAAAAVEVDADFNLADVISDDADVIADVDATITCPDPYGELEASEVITLAPGASITCSYEAESATWSETFDGTNTATATLQTETYDSALSGTTKDAADWTETSNTADVNFGNAVITEIDESATLVDDNGTPGDTGDDHDLGTFTGDGSAGYTGEFTCGTTQIDNTNTATLTLVDSGDELTDDQLVTIHCYDLDVTKTVTTSFTRTYEWTVDKSVDRDEWWAFENDVVKPDYTVDVTRTFTDSNHKVEGTITITNPNPNLAAPLTDVVDEITAGPVAATVDCGGVTEVPADDAIDCSYEVVDDANFASDFTGTNTATATLQNRTWTDEDGTLTDVDDGTTDYSGTEAVDFGDADITEIDESATLVDDNGTPGDTGDDHDLGTFTGDGSAGYTGEFTCGTTQIDNTNTATLTLVDSGDELTDDQLVTIHCYDLDVTKTVTTSFTRTYEWTVDKSVDRDEWWAFENDVVKPDYTIDVTRTPLPSMFGVSGTITITNPNPNIAAELTDVVDDIDGVSATVDCGGVTEVPANDSIECSYNAEDASWDQDFVGTNTATATLQNKTWTDEDGTLTDVDDGTTDYSGSETVDFSSTDPANIELIDEEATLVDDNGTPGDTGDDHDLGTFTGDGSAGYTGEFTCGTTQIDNTNTATLTLVDTGTELTDDQLVTIHCYELDVTKTVATSFDRDWTWDIVKDAFRDGDHSLIAAEDLPLALDPGQDFLVQYDIVVTATYEDSNHKVEGTITITNPNPNLAAPLTDVVDEITAGPVAATVDCGGATEVPADDAIDCSYEVVDDANFASDFTGTNTATATLQNRTWTDEDGTLTDVDIVDGTTDYDGTADVDFTGATITETDECVTVSDDFATPGETGDDPIFDPDTVCASVGDQEFTFTYDRLFEADALECGLNEFTNTASFVTNDNEETGDDDAFVSFDVVCVEGCTLTQGYWKTHNVSFWGGAPPDDDWLDVDGEDWDEDGNLGWDNDNNLEAELEDFFLSGQTWFDVFWTAPKGNPYYNLAHQWMAAHLNIIDGTSMPADVQEAYDAAVELLTTTSPDDPRLGKGKDGDKDFKALFIDYAGTLAEYNEGLAGIPHCDDDHFDVDQTSARVTASGEALEAGEELTAEDGTEPKTELKTASGDESAKDLDVSEATSDEAVAAKADDAAQPVAEIPTEFSVENYPNPFNPTTTLRIEVPEASQVTLVIYDMLGREVARLVDGGLEAGVHQVTWNASTLPSGMYLYALRAGSFKQVGSMVLAK